MRVEGSAHALANSADTTALLMMQVRGGIY